MFLGVFLLTKYSKATINSFKGKGRKRRRKKAKLIYEIIIQLENKLVKVLLLIIKKWKV